MLSVYISLGGYAVAGAPGNRPLRHRQGALGCGAASGPQQERRHAIDDVEDILSDVRKVALSQRLHALHCVVQEPELPLHRELSAFRMFADRERPNTTVVIQNRNEVLPP